MRYLLAIFVMGWMALAPGGAWAQTGCPTVGNCSAIQQIYRRLQATPTISTTAYSSGQNVGGLISYAMPLTGGGILQSYGIQSIAGLVPVNGLNCMFFDSLPSATFTNGSTMPTLSAADEAKRINKVMATLTPTLQTGDASSGASVDNYAKPFNATSTIYEACSATGSITFSASTDLVTNISFLQGPN